LTDTPTTPGGGDRTPPPGVVLDCDGVLVDSEPLHAWATTEWAKTVGITLHPEYFDDLVGMTVFDQIAHIVKGTGHDPAEAYQARESHFWSLIDQIEPMIGVVDLIRRLHGAGVRIAIASNGSRDYLEHVIEALEIDGMINGFVCADDTTHPKPHPEPYLKAAALLDLSPTSCVAVEDSDPGVTSALAAGMAVIMINATPLAGATYPENVTVVASHHHVEEMFFAHDPPYVTNSP
jgi:HAD superfamily hydrolase (TIGR01509 family)